MTISYFDATRSENFRTTRFDCESVDRGHHVRLTNEALDLYASEIVSRGEKKNDNGRVADVLMKSTSLLRKIIYGQPMHTQAQLSFQFTLQMEMKRRPWDSSGV